MASEKRIEDMDTTEICSRLLMAWCFREVEATQKNQPMECITIETEDPICRILAHRIKCFDVKIPMELGLLISLCSHGNPGMSIMMLYMVIEMTAGRYKGKVPAGYTIKAEDYSLTFTTFFPDTNNPIAQKKLEQRWDGQKDERGNNKVDTFEYWEKFLHVVK